MTDYLRKVSKDLPIKKVYSNVPASYWDEGWILRGQHIDEAVNLHKEGVGLGTYFPVADRVTDRVLVSTKSVDLLANSYHNPQKLKGTLNRALNQLDGIEGLFDTSGKLVRKGSKELTLAEFDSKALEIILPDVVISEEVYKTLIEFKKTANMCGIDVWFCITDY